MNSNHTITVTRGQNPLLLRKNLHCRVWPAREHPWIQLHLNIVLAPDLKCCGSDRIVANIILPPDLQVCCPDIIVQLKMTWFIVCNLNKTYAATSSFIIKVVHIT
jgi:hypothetical protein